MCSSNVRGVIAPRASDRRLAPSLRSPRPRGSSSARPSLLVPDPLDGHRQVDRDSAESGQADSRAESGQAGSRWRWPWRTGLRCCFALHPVVQSRQPLSRGDPVTAGSRSWPRPYPSPRDVDQGSHSYNRRIGAAAPTLNIFRVFFSIVSLRHAPKRARPGAERRVHLRFTAAQAALFAPVPAKYNKGGCHG